MPDIKLYTKDYCPYCVKAKALLTKKGVAFTEIDVGRDEAAFQEMLSKSEGRKTVPQIFIGDKAIGGFDDMAALDRDGKLDGMLK